MGSVPFVSVKTAMPHFAAEKHWNDSNEYSASTHSHMFHWDWKFPHLRRASAADWRCWTTTDTAKTITWHSSARFTRGFDFLVSVREPGQEPSCFCVSLSFHRSPELVRVTLGCEMWVLGRCRIQTDTGALLTREDALTCQSCHSSVNSRLILCWKLVLPGPRGQRWPPPPSPQLQELWLRGKKISRCFFKWIPVKKTLGGRGGCTKCTLSTFAEGIKTSFVHQPQKYMFTSQFASYSVWGKRHTVESILVLQYVWV